MLDTDLLTREIRRIAAPDGYVERLLAALYLMDCGYLPLGLESDA